MLTLLLPCRGIAHVVFSAALALSLSGCWIGAGNILDSEQTVSIAGFYGTGQKVFQAGDTILVLEISPTDARFRISADGEWARISHIRKIEGEPPGHYVAVVPEDASSAQASYIPFVYRKSGITVPNDMGAIKSKEELIARTRAAYQAQKVTTWELLSAEAGKVALSRSKAAKDASKSNPAPKTEAEVSSFRGDGYLYPRLFEAIYRGDTRGLNPAPVAYYLQTFSLMFRHAEDDRSCNAMITAPAVSALTVLASADSLNKLFGPLFEAHQRGSRGRDQAFADGAGAGSQAVGSLLEAEMRGESDAQLFYSRHRCTSPTAVRFFVNFNRFAVQK